MSDYLVLDEAAAVAGIDRETLYNLVRRGEIHGVKVSDGRWFVHRVNAEAHRAGAPGGPGPAEE